MDLTVFLHPTAGGLVCAIGAVVAGAPLFSDGVRAVRLRRFLATLSERPIGPDLSGFTHVSGRVAIESPMFPPLSPEPCAGFQLEVHGIGTLIAKSVEARRAFRVTSGTGSVRVDPAGGRWALPVTAEREVAPDETLTQAQERLLQRVPDAVLWRRAGGRLRLVERSLRAGAPCHVVGFARQTGVAPQAAAEVVGARTGTDDAAVVLAEAPALETWIGPGEFLDFLFVSDRAPEPAALAPSRWRSVGAVLGPALSLLGLLYLASAADALRALGRL
jgi:hypothetical protein